MKNALLWLMVPVILVVAYQSAKENPVSSGLPAVPDTGNVEERVEPQVVVTPADLKQGEPALISITGTSTASTITWKGKQVETFLYNGKPSALIGVDIRATPGTYPVVATLADGTRITENVVVAKRVVPTAPLGIPDNLGGNTPEAEQTLLTTLAQENAILNDVKTESRPLWTEAFGWPVKDPIVTDEYGYNRQTGASTISHKGTDFRAAVGTPIYAMNDGVVRIAREFRNYGYTVVIDHGLGVQTLYMHLSELGVKPGETVRKGQEIAKSGKTGYSEFPHLHISVKIGGISIDPMVFMDLFKGV
jgi:hypothetical protein